MRISVYTHDERSEEFALIGRYSFNNEYTKKGRASYPRSSGAIGIAWNEGQADIRIKASPENEWIAYRRELMAYQMPEQQIENLSMKSVSFFARRLTGGSSPNSTIGVVLVESILPELTPIELDLVARVEKDDGYVVRNVMLHEYALHKSYPREELP
jgi:hypothetical protein